MLDTQEKKMLEYINVHGSISTREAVRQLDIMRPAAVVCELRKKNGVDFIITEMKTSKTGKRYAEYKLGKVG